MDTNTVKVLSDCVKVISEAINIHHKAILTLKEKIDDIERTHDEKTHVPMTEEQEYRNAGISKEEARK